MAEFVRLVWYYLTWLVPRPFPVYPDEGGVMCRFGHYVATLQTGWHWIWPPIHYVQKVTTTEQVVDLKPQSLTTSDGRRLAISGAVGYSVADPKRAILGVHDYDLSLPVLALGVIAHHVTTHSAVECSDPEAMAAIVQDGIRKIAVARWGLRIMRVWITDLADHTVFRILGDSAAVLPYGDETAPESIGVTR